MVLHPHGLLDDVDSVTGYPGMKGGMKRSSDLVCYSNQVLTS